MQLDLEGDKQDLFYSQVLLKENLIMVGCECNRFGFLFILAFKIKINCLFLTVIKSLNVISDFNSI